MVGWHHRLNGHEFEQTPGVGDGQGRLACCSPWGHKESDRTRRLNNNKGQMRLWHQGFVNCRVLCMVRVSSQHSVVERLV